MLIFSAVETSIEFLHYFCLFVEKSGLFIFILILLSCIELETASISSPYSLDHSNCPFFILKFPLLPKHSYPFLNPYSSRIIFTPLLFSLIYPMIILVYNTSVSFLSFLKVKCHF